MDREQRLQLKGMLAESRERLQMLRKQIERHRVNLTTEIFPKKMTGPADGVDIEKAQLTFNDWKKAVQDYRDLQEQSTRLEEELGIEEWR